MPMSSNTVNISDQDVENRPPSEPLSCTNNTNGLSISNPPSIKRNNYMKQGGRRRKWWYFNRGLQPISELAEIKDDAVKCDDHDDSSTTLDDSYVINNYSPTNNTNTIISSDSTPQNKESYSACLKLIEKFQEVVMDSAVRVIQAAFKRFRERRRFLRIKKAVMVIQRNLRKWLETKHPCIRPAEFERQSSDGSKSDEYRESIENESEDCVTEEKDEMENNSESEKCQENNNTNEKLSSVQNNTLDNLQENALDVENVNAELELNDKTVGVQLTCLSKSELEETVESSATEDGKLVTISAESKQEIVKNENSLLGEVITGSNFLDSDGQENQSEESKDIDPTDISFSAGLKLKDETQAIETQEHTLSKANLEVEQDNLHCENENHIKTTAGDDLKDKEDQVLNVLNNNKEEQVINATSPDSLKVLCQKSLCASEISNSCNTGNAES